MTEPALPRMRPAGQARQRAVDVAIAVVVTLAQLGARYASASWGAHARSAPTWYVDVLLAVAGLALAARRRFPVAVLAVSLAATLVAGKIGTGGTTWIALIAAFVNAELAGKRLAAGASLVIGYLSSIWPPWRIGQPGHTSTAATLGIAAWLLTLLVIAELIRSRSQRAAAVRRTQEEQLRRRASEDRMRIARDLHDVLAHNISVINVQANTALHLMDRQPDRAKEALTAIHAVSKQALTELRAVLGVLRDGDGGDDGAPRAPSPGLARLSDLLSSFRSAGLLVELTIEGEARPVAADADIAAYRIVQESLTNTTRHSAAGSAAVLVRYEPAGVLVRVTDEGPAVAARDGVPVTARAGSGAAAGAPTIGTTATGLTALATTGSSASRIQPGNGITGMAERVRDLAGTFEAGPRADGGFLVQAWLPAGASIPAGKSPPEAQASDAADSDAADSDAAEPRAAR
jgi:signal transduction histidine kinase